LPSRLRCSKSVQSDKGEAMKKAAIALGLLLLLGIFYFEYSNWSDRKEKEARIQQALKQAEEQERFERLLESNKREVQAANRAEENRKARESTQKFEQAWEEKKRQQAQAAAEIKKADDAARAVPTVPFPVSELTPELAPPPPPDWATSAPAKIPTPKTTATKRSR
jgi:FtsZ-interacting cell division protein ZipA